jgi:hypothetical protein
MPKTKIDAEEIMSDCYSEKIKLKKGLLFEDIMKQIVENY